MEQLSNLAKKMAASFSEEYKKHPKTSKLALAVGLGTSGALLWGQSTKNAIESIAKKTGISSSMLDPATIASNTELCA